MNAIARPQHHQLTALVVPLWRVPGSQRLLVGRLLVHDDILPDRTGRRPLMLETRRSVGLAPRTRRTFGGGDIWCLLDRLTAQRPRRRPAGASWCWPERRAMVTLPTPTAAVPTTGPMSTKGHRSPHVAFVPMMSATPSANIVIAIRKQSEASARRCFLVAPSARGRRRPCSGALRVGSSSIGL